MMYSFNNMLEIYNENAQISASMPKFVIINTLHLSNDKTN